MRRSVVNIGTDTGGITVEESASEGRFPGERRMLRERSTVRIGIK